MHKLLLVFVLLGIVLCAKAQLSLDKGFVSDGLHHRFIVKPLTSEAVHVVFYPFFRYQLVVIGNTQTNVIWKLTSNQGIVLFTNSNKTYIRKWNFEFASIMNGVLEIKPMDGKSNDTINLLIGFRPVLPK